MSCPSDSTRWTSARFCLSRPYRGPEREALRPLIEFLYVPLHGRYTAIHTARLGGVSRMTPPRSIEIGARALGMPSLSFRQVDLGAGEHSVREAKKAAVRGPDKGTTSTQQYKVRTACWLILSPIIRIRDLENSRNRITSNCPSRNMCWSIWLKAVVPLPGLL